MTQAPVQAAPGFPETIVLARTVDSNPSYCIDLVNNVAPYNGAAIQLFRCNGTTAQMWIFR